MTLNSEIMTRLTNDKRVNDPSDTLNGGISDFLLRFYLSPAPPRATWENQRHCDEDYFCVDFLLLSWIINQPVIGWSWLKKRTHWAYPFNIAWCIIEINVYGIRVTGFLLWVSKCDLSYSEDLCWLHENKQQEGVCPKKRQLSNFPCIHPLSLLWR